MTVRDRRWAALAVAVASLAPTGAAMAQAQGPGTATSGASQSEQGLSTALYGQAAPTPFTPYLNPYLMQMSPGNPDYLTYMYLNNQRNGGIGSGVISGTRPAPGVPAGSTRPGQVAAPAQGATASPMARNTPYAASRPSVGQNRVTLPLLPPGPGANSGGYFMRGPSGQQGAARYFNRTTPTRNAGR
jgi:hypothetical protein